MRYGSICSGIEAATVAWHPLGSKPAFFSEIDTFPRAVLAHHYQETPLHGDFTTIEADQYAAIDVLVGGTPCQSFSVAGLRKGLDDERGNLALEFCRLARRLGPRWVVWENVPGVLSLDGGRAFASILGGLAECGYGLAYRVLDAQFVRVDGFARAVPQRRRRVFVVGHLGDWRRAAAVLFERESLLGNTAPRRQAGQGAAPTLAARTRGGGGLGTDFDCDGGLVPLNDLGGVSHTLQAARGGSKALDATMETYVAHTLNAKGGVGRLDYESETLVAHSLRGGGFDASEDGTGRGTPLVSVQGVALRGRDDGATAELTGDVMTALRTGGGGGDKPHVLAPIVFDETQITSATNRCQPQAGDPSHPLAAGARPPTIAFSVKDHGADAQDDVAPTLRAMGHVGIFSQWRARHLMPLECERLQGFPDGYTAIRYRGKEAADGPRYKALGNSMAVNVMRWIGWRIQMVDSIVG